MATKLDLKTLVSVCHKIFRVSQVTTYTWDRYDLLTVPTYPQGPTKVLGI